MGFIKEFKEFAMRGNVLDMAVGVVVGGAFGKIVTSLVNNIIMPPFGVLLGGIDFSDFFIPLSTEHVESLAEAKAAGIPVIAYGAFLNTVLEFLIIAFAIFIVIKQLNRFLPKPEPVVSRFFRKFISSASKYRNQIYGFSSSFGCSISILNRCSMSI